MTGIELSIIVGGLVFVLVGIWCVQANRNWTRLLAAEDPRLAYDPVRDPAGWVRGAGYRARTWLARLRVRDERPAVEYWRVRTVHRFVVWVGLSMLAFLVGGATIAHVAAFAEASIERYGFTFGILSVGIFGFILAYYLGQIGRTLVEFGNGRRPSMTELAVGLGGIIAALIAMAVMPHLDLSKP